MIEPDVSLVTGLLHGCTEGRVGCHTAGNGQLVITVFLRRQNRTAHQGLHHCILERRNQIRYVNLFAGHMSFVDIVQHSRLQATEAKIVRGALHLRPRELDGVGIAFFCSLVHLWSTRVAEAHRAGHFIECFTSRVIAGTADNFKFAVVLHNNQMGMSAGHDQAHKGRLQIRIFKKVRRHMALNMMYAHQRLFRRKSNGFCLSHTN